MSAIDNQALRWFALQSERALNDEERAELDAWLAEDTRHQGAFVRAAVIHNALRQATSQQGRSPGEDRYALRSEASGPAMQPGRRQLLRYGAVAACMAGVGLAGVLALQSGTSTLTTETGEFRRVALADSSVASINSGTELQVKVTQHERQVTLHRGEAWFDVAKDKAKPFVVEAGEVRARAVGTAFGVRRFQGGAEILVTEGLVEVWSDADTNMRKLVGAGERAVIKENTTGIFVARQPGEIDRKLAWREGKLIFTRQTLSDAVADFNRYSERKIVIIDSSIKDKRIVGQYQTDAPEQFARDIGAYLNVPIVITADKILIGSGTK